MQGQAQRQEDQIYLSPNTDPYVPQERAERITRRLLEVMCEFPPALLVVQTRSPLVSRDLDLFRTLGDRVVVALSITTNREDIRRLFEPHCPPIAARVAALAAIHAAGIRTQASVAPFLPCDPDHLANQISPHCDWVTVQALKMGGGARTWRPALDLIQCHQLEGWLQGGQDVREAMQRLRDSFGPRYHEAREGFSLSWL